MCVCSLVDCSLPGSSDNGILQTRILERVATSSSRGSSRPRDQTHVSCLAVDFFTTEPQGKQGVLGMTSLNTHAMLTACFPLHLWTKNVTGLFSKQRLSPWHQLLASAAAPKGAPWGQFRMEQSKLLALNSSDAHLEMISTGQTLYCPIHKKALKSLTWDIWCF